MPVLIQEFKIDTEYVFISRRFSYFKWKKYCLERQNELERDFLCASWLKKLIEKLFLENFYVSQRFVWKLHNISEVNWKIYGKSFTIYFHCLREVILRFYYLSVNTLSSFPLETKCEDQSVCFGVEFLSIFGKT